MALKSIQFELSLREEHVSEFKKIYGGLIPIYPDVIQYAFGQLSLIPQFSRLRSNRFDYRTSRVHFSGRAVEAAVEPSIYEVSYQVEAFGNPLTLLGFNTYFTIQGPHSHGSIDRALDNADVVVEIIGREVEGSMRKKAIGDKVNPSILGIRTPGATSNAYAHKLDREFKERLPRAYYIDIFQVNKLTEVSKEEASRRFDLIIEDVRFWVESNWKMIIIYPLISKLSSTDASAHGQRLFNDKMYELLSFIIELQAEYTNFIKTKAISPALDLEYIRLFNDRKIIIPSTVNNIPINFDNIEWFMDSKLLAHLKDELKDRIFIIGLFGSSDMLNSIKTLVGNDVRAFAIRSNKYDRKYILGIQLKEEEAKEIISNFKESHWS
jgi:hypothetical protein